MPVSYSTLSSNFAKIKGIDIPTVGSTIGGKVQQNINAGIFKNTCAIRLSYAFNYSGIPISKLDGAVSSGGDKKWYLYRVSDMISFVKKTVGKAPIKGKSKKDFIGKKGIIIFTGCGWTDASGHVDLFDGKNVEGLDYFARCTNAELYVLN